MWRIVEPIISLSMFLALLVGVGYLLLHTGFGFALFSWLAIGTSIGTALALLMALFQALDGPGN